MSDSGRIGVEDGPLLRFIESVFDRYAGKAGHKAGDLFRCSGVRFRCVRGLQRRVQNSQLAGTPVSQASGSHLSDVLPKQ